MLVYFVFFLSSMQRTAIVQAFYTLSIYSTSTKADRKLQRPVIDHKERCQGLCFQFESYKECKFQESCSRSHSTANGLYKKLVTIVARVVNRRKFALYVRQFSVARKTAMMMGYWKRIYIYQKGKYFSICRPFYIAYAYVVWNYI